MIGIDTNILVRFITQDDPEQSPIANDVLLNRVTETDPGFVTTVAVTEMAWVLERTYQCPPSEIAGAIERILQLDNLNVENEQMVFAAMTVVKAGIGTFADALIGAVGNQAGCRHTLTFDRKALRLPEFIEP